MVEHVDKITKWSQLKFWKSGECQAALERLKESKPYCPDRANLFKALRSVPPDKVRVAVVGQDPYPDPKLATGLAFSIPETESVFPPTLKNLFKEYSDDLQHPYPRCGTLLPWVDRGVLLWNAIPSCGAWHSLSHDWPEWHLLTQQVLQAINHEHMVYVFLGGVARRHANIVTRGTVIELSHPSPRASAASNNPFLGSKVFSRVNNSLERWGLEPINWRLDDGEIQNAKAAESNSS